MTRSDKTKVAGLPWLTLGGVVKVGQFQGLQATSVSGYTSPCTYVTNIVTGSTLAVYTLRRLVS